MKTALLYSAGLDSACLFWILGQPDSLYFGGVNGPARYANGGELAAIAKHQQAVPDRIRALAFDFRPFMRSNPENGQWRHPRHQIVSMLAWAEGYDQVLLGWCKDDGTGNALEDYRAQFEGAVGMPGFHVDFPAINKTKVELIEGALAVGAPLEFLHDSFSCVARGDQHCGECVNCKQRRQAFIDAGYPEPAGTYRTG